MKKEYLHKLPVRIWHWVNAFIVIMLILTGVQLRVSDIALFSNYGVAVLLHKYLGYALAVSFLFWLLYNLFSGEMKRHYMIRTEDIKAIPGQAFYYLYFIFRKGKNPFQPSINGKFNPLQKIAYLSVMFICTPLIILTGILFSDVQYFIKLVNMIGGIRILDAIHVSVGYIFVIYLIVHLYMATLGRKLYSYIKSMITGYHENH